MPQLKQSVMKIQGRAAGNDQQSKKSLTSHIRSDENKFQQKPESVGESIDIINKKGQKPTLKQHKNQINKKTLPITQQPSKQNNWNQQLKKNQLQRNNNRKQSMKSIKVSQRQIIQDQANNDQELFQEESIQKEQINGINKKTTQSINMLTTNNSNNHIPLSSQKPFAQLRKRTISTSPKQPSSQQLISISKKNQQKIKQLKQQIFQYRQQLKKIGQQVDEDLQKSMIGININGNNKLSIKQKNVNIKELFSQKINKNETQKIKKLRQQLFSIRKQSKQIKQQIAIKSQLINDPVNKQNNYKHQQLLSRLKMMNIQLSNKQKEIGLIKEQVKRLKVSANIDELEQMQKNISDSQIAISKVVNQIKEQKTKAYKLQKQDIILMQKLKFLTQKNNQQSINNNNNTTNNTNTTKPTTQQLKQQVKTIIQEINQILQQRNKTQTQRTRILRQFNSQIEQYQQRNLSMVAQLRNIDAYLLQHYSQQKHQNKVNLSNVNNSNNNNRSSGVKTAQKQTPKKQKIKLMQMSNDSMLQSGYNNKNTQSPLVQTKESKQISSMKINDKNITNITIGNNNNNNIINTSTATKFRTKVAVSQNVNKYNSNKLVSKNKQSLSSQAMVNTQQQQHQLEQQQFSKNKQKQQRVTYIFGDMKIDDKGAILSDQILGNVKLKQFTLLVDDQHCYGIYCKYINQQGKQVNGMKIHQKNAQQITNKLTITIKNDEFIQQIRVGYSSTTRHDIKLVQIVTNTVNNNNTNSNINSNIKLNTNRSQLKWMAKSYQHANNNNISCNSNKIDEIKLKQYNSLSIKAKLISTQEIHTVSKSLNQLGKVKPKLKLAGFMINCLLYKK